MMPVQNEQEEQLSESIHSDDNNLTSYLGLRSSQPVKSEMRSRARMQSTINGILNPTGSSSSTTNPQSTSNNMSNDETKTLLMRMQEIEENRKNDQKEIRSLKQQIVALSNADRFTMRFEKYSKRVDVERHEETISERWNDEDSESGNFEGENFMGQTNIIRIKGKFIEDGVQTLDEDAYTLMMISRNPLSPGYFYGIVAFIVQTLFVAQAIVDELERPFGQSIFNIPAHATIPVRFVQFLALVCSVFIQEDVLSALRIPFTLRYKGINPWEKTIRATDTTLFTWITRILIPSCLKFTTGALVLFAAWVVVVQSEGVVDLLKDFTALFIITEIDNVMLRVAAHGYFGHQFEIKAKEAQGVKIYLSDKELVKKKKRKFFSSKVFFYNLLMIIILTAWFVVIWGQRTGVFVRQKYPLCFLDEDFNEKQIDHTKIADGTCVGVYNIPECGYDGGDCDEFNTRFPNCEVPFPSLITNGECNPFPYNSIACGFDGGDCLSFNREHLTCKTSLIDPSSEVELIEEPWRVGDGHCDKGAYDTSFCHWDGGDCLGLPYNVRRPDCHVDDPFKLGDGNCDGGDYNSLVCGWDEGDCDDWNVLRLEQYKYCEVSEPYRIGNGVCDVTDDLEYDNLYCLFDGGDCLSTAFEDRFPNCPHSTCANLNELQCQHNYIPLEHHDELGMSCNVLECGYQAGQCSIPEYPNCRTNPIKLGDNECLEPNEWSNNNSPECNYDFGDCLESKYPNCTVPKLDQGRLGDGFCDPLPYDTLECGFDGGDCINATFGERYPDCKDFTIEGSISGASDLGLEVYVGDGHCHQGTINSVECKFDGGDCVEFNRNYPNCTFAEPSKIGNGVCLLEANTEECKWDGGDCLEYNTLYPNCTEVSGGWAVPSWLGDGYCDPDNNFPECGSDEGDCTEENEELWKTYPNCFGVIPSQIGDGKCQAWFNSTACGYDGGDCLPTESP